MSEEMSEMYKRVLRPIAEVLAMQDGNAFFGMEIDEQGNDEFVDQYLPGARELFEDNGGMSGWAGKASFAEPFQCVEFPENRKSE